MITVKFGRFLDDSYHRPIYVRNPQNAPGYYNQIGVASYVGNKLYDLNYFDVRNNPAITSPITTVRSLTIAEIRSHVKENVTVRV